MYIFAGGKQIKRKLWVRPPGLSDFGQKWVLVFSAEKPLPNLQSSSSFVGPSLVFQNNPLPIHRILYEQARAGSCPSPF
uniref:Uncharacterized protein n=1 Tax=Anguilla anguilla TaxID=7936 RepID=A0A0E9TZI6_ANGAN